MGSRLIRTVLMFGLVLATLVALSGMAWAQTGSGGTSLDLFDKAQLVALIGGTVLPFVVALLTKAHASKLVKSLMAVIAAGLVALGTYLTNTGGSTTWRGALSVFVITIIVAAGTRVTVTGGADDALARKTAGLGVG